MIGFEREEQCRLESAARLSQKMLDDAIHRGSGDLISLRSNLNRAREDLRVWGDHVLQVFSPPAGMVAVFEREDGLEEYIPISYLGLTRGGRVYPYMLLGNCESKMPADYPNFLRIDNVHVMTNEVAFEVMGTELAPA